MLILIALALELLGFVLLTYDVWINPRRKSYLGGDSRNWLQLTGFVVVLIGAGIQLTMQAAIVLG